MAFIPIPNGVQLCFQFTTAGQNWQFCLQLRKSAGSPSPTDLEDVGDLAEGWYNSDLKPLLTNQSMLNQVVTTDQTVQGGPQFIGVSGNVGTATGNSMPLNAAAVVSQRTAKRGRSYRGRAYISGLSESSQNGPVDIGSTLATDLGDAFTALQIGLDAIGFDVVVASKQHNGVVTNPAATNEVIAFLVDTHLDSQRRRLAGRGT